MSAHAAVVFAQYMMLSVQQREAEDPWTMGELFRLCCDKLEEAPWIDALEQLMGLFVEFLSEHFDISETDVDSMVAGFISVLPDHIKRLLNAV